MGQSMPKPGLRPFLPADARLRGDLRGEHQRADRPTTTPRRSARPGSPALDEDTLAAKLGKQLTLIATLREAPVGFASLKDGNHIDFLYVHPGAVGHGVATALLDALEKLAGRARRDKTDRRRQRYRAPFLYAPRLR